MCLCVYYIYILYVFVCHCVRYLGVPRGGADEEDAAVEVGEGRRAGGLAQHLQVEGLHLFFFWGGGVFLRQIYRSV